MSRILLISPDFHPEHAKIMAGMSLHGGAQRKSPISTRQFMVPLGLASVAALTPGDIEVDIWDEGVDGLVDEQTRFGKDYDLVGVTGYENHTRRMLELGRLFRRLGIPVAVGGPAVSASPEHYRDHFDILFIGEAEYTWPKFIEEWRAGSHRREYRQVSKVDMSDSPLPRWDKVRTDRYFVGAVQTTRGCPFDCEFCDVIYIYGRQARHKSVGRVLEEIRALERLGTGAIFLCDDNFIGNPSYAKALLKELIPVNRSFRQPIDFFTQITLNVAKDEEMLEALSEAGFAGLFIGIETPNVESLKEANKPQNYRTDIVEDVKKIQSYGIPIRAGMIVGFDHDDTSIFHKQFEFLQEAAIATPFINTLKAPAGTKLWVRLHREGRVVEFDDQATAPGDKETPGSEFSTNIIPKRMTRIELLAGYRDLIRQVRDWKNFETRIKTMISRVRHPPAEKVSLKLFLLALYVVLFHVNRDARRVALRLMFYTLRHAPSMMKRVLRLTWNQYLDAVRLPMMLEGIDEQIRRETEEGQKLRPAATVFLVPDAFKKPYRAVFPELYQRVYLGLEDKSRIHDALTEVTYDFLTRWGPSFEEFGEHHRSFLYELCDRTLAKENGDVQAAAEKKLPAGMPDAKEGLGEGQAGVWVKRLSDEVLRVVEQDLRNFQPQTWDERVS
jgi:radical SAM superfamily enzyme YgiQ (UPF0313 family)